MATFNIRVTKRLQIASVLFTGQQMNALGRTTIDAMKRRWAQGLDVQDQPAQPLHVGYSRRKQRRGANPIPDLRLTGQMYAALGVQIAEPGRCKIGFSDQQSILKAYANHQRRHQIGISDNDAREVAPLAAQFLIENIRSAVRSVAA